MVKRTHIIPQLYLKNFEDRDGHIHVYGRTRDKFVTGKINVGVNSGFYSDDLEDKINRLIESPVSPVVRGILNEDTLTPQMRNTFANFVNNLIKRGPGGKNLVHSRIDRGKKELKSEIDEMIYTEIKLNPEIKSDLVEKHSILLDILENYETESVWNIFTNPEFDSRIPSLILKMDWTFLTSTNNQYFVSSDNPVYMSLLVDKDSDVAEISFPISKNMAFLASFHTSNQSLYREATAGIVKEINRRTISNSNHDVYSPAKYDWIIEVMIKNHRPKRII